MDKFLGVQEIQATDDLFYVYIQGLGFSFFWNWFGLKEISKAAFWKGENRPEKMVF